MWRWSEWITTELPLSVGPPSPSIRQEGSLCTLWHINPLHKLDEWCVLSTQSTPLTQVWWSMTLTQQPSMLSLLRLAQQGVKCGALLVQVSAYSCLNARTATTECWPCCWLWLPVHSLHIAHDTTFCCWWMLMKLILVLEVVRVS